MLNALNEKLRDDYIKDAVAGIERWNKIIEKAGIAVPAQARRTRRSTARSAPLAGGARRPRRARRVARPSGRTATCSGCRREADRAFVASLMGRVAEPGKFANWIAPPARGINNQPVDFEYVRFN